VALIKDNSPRYFITLNKDAGVIAKNMLCLLPGRNRLSGYRITILPQAYLVMFASSMTGGRHV
jgi:hypothetical protein